MKTVLIQITIAISASPAYGYIQSHHLNIISKPRRSGASSSLTPLAMSAGEDKQDILPTKAIKQAIEATKKYGATSYKARLSWEVVEKMEYAYKNSSTEINKKTGDEDDKSKTRRDVIKDEAAFDAVESKVRDLKSLIDKEMAKVQDLKNMANKIKEVKHTPQSINGKKSIEAITAAQEATREYGIHSAQTTLAWEAFEEVVSGDLADLAP
mmetsp:Transcript_16248/g.34335  ORF Transcript_16248/g.34335 Transcript_16248/m.34335 type:complete len:211 (-) Transcript_16248:203-835(-)|eukprot:CAMPEP_0196148372 /NCGR_PEP_ID=MMETSP0910-20130528/27587_1 /TAXON_ID=49265 /ORGANISM="Thalassiosira rotula, Strain GSO102" /LENGTH=210 /DNA_ID=CAMNT_0041411059 /DNA_START=25 /DNA_END=657 /DNA_ORIENTATION=+